MIGLEKQLDHPIFTEENARDVQVEDPLCVNAAKSVNVSPETAFVQLVILFIEDHMREISLRKS